MCLADICVYAPHVRVIPGGQKTIWDPLELGLQMVGAGNETWVSEKGRQSSYCKVGHLSSSYITFS